MAVLVGLDCPPPVAVLVGLGLLLLQGCEGRHGLPRRSCRVTARIHRPLSGVYCGMGAALARLAPSVHQVPQLAAIGYAPSPHSSLLQWALQAAGASPAAAAGKTKQKYAGTSSGCPQRSYDVWLPDLPVPSTRIYVVMPSEVWSAAQSGTPIPHTPGRRLLGEALRGVITRVAHQSRLAAV